MHPIDPFENIKLMAPTHSPVALWNIRTHSSNDAMLPHIVSVPANSPRPPRTSIATLPK